MKKRKASVDETIKQEFKKDLELFAYFLVLLNASSPIRNVELMWAEDLDFFEPAQRPRVTTGAALVQIQGSGSEMTPARSSPSPSTYFCDLVHGFGAHEEQTCARSDKPAKELCRNTGRSQVYPCHVGLTDIAVPVFCEGRYLGTLFSGQVLTQRATPEGFAQVRAALANQPHIDFTRLEEAYFHVPVVTTAQLADMVRMLEVFARYIGNAWKRLEILSTFQQMRERELALDRREFAEQLLAGHSTTTPTNLEALAYSVGMERLPDRVLVLRLCDPAEPVSQPHSVSSSVAAPSAAAIGNQLTLGRVSHMIEDRCRGWPNTLATVMAHGEICILTSQQARTAHQEHLLTEEIAQTLLRIAGAHSMTTARIGISSLHPQTAELLGAYHEAASALNARPSSINWFEALPARPREPTQALSKILKAIQTGDSRAISASLRELLVTAAPAGSSTFALQQMRGLLTWACEHLTREIIEIGGNATTVNAARERAIQLIMGAANSFTMSEAFRSFVEQLRQQVVHLFSQREEKIVSETQRLVRELGPEKATIHDLAQALQLSAGHLGRVYKRTTGHTLEEYLIRQRLEMSKRLLLDPRLQVASVADLCGFCNPAYFASVFKKYMHCTPRAYAKQPQRCGALESDDMPQWQEGPAGLSDTMGDVHARLDLHSTTHGGA